MDVTITLIVPVYNVEKYLTECLESIVGQSVAFDEVILVNDGSTDQSRLVCEKFISQYDCFKLINQENKGPSIARNVGLSYASGEYIMFLDSDDYLREDTVEKLKKELGKPGVDAVYFDADIVCEEGYGDRKNIYGRNIKNLAGIQMSGDMFLGKTYPGNYIASACMAAYRKEVVKSAGIRFPEGLYYEDTYFTFAFMAQAKTVVYLPEKLYQRRYRANSTMTSEYTERKFNNIIRIILLIWDEAVKCKNLVLSENKIYLKLVSDYCGIGLERYRLCKKNNITLHDDSQDLFYDMVKGYGPFVEQYCLDGGMELNLLNSILKNIKKIMLLCPEYQTMAKLLLKKVRDTVYRFRIYEKIERFYKKLLCDLPLNVEGCKVGIYGTGDHTEGLLAVYERLVGEITCSLVFIDSYRENGSYLGRDIINFRQVDYSFDLIIISSFLYEQEMIENVRSINEKISIGAFYDGLKEDVFSGWDVYLK